VAGPVERAIRATIREGEGLQTPIQQAPFSVARLTDESLVLLLGAKQASTPLRWSCLEGVPDFLRGQGWLPIGGVFESSSDPRTFDAYMKTCVKRATAGWVAVVLERAGVAEIDRGRPARIRLVPGFRG
jgi:hypothetical protein